MFAFFEAQRETTTVHPFVDFQISAIAWHTSAVAMKAKKEVTMIYASVNLNKVPEDVMRQFPKTEQFGYELIQLKLRAICDTMQDRDSMCVQANDAHPYVAAVGPRPTKNKRWYGIYW